MTWDEAVTRAFRQARLTGRKHYVFGYRTLLGVWRYGAYRKYRPEIGRTWR